MKRPFYSNALLGGIGGALLTGAVAWYGANHVEPEAQPAFFGRAAGIAVPAGLVVIAAALVWQHLWVRRFRRAFAEGDAATLKLVAALMQMLYRSKPFALVRVIHASG